MNTDGHRFGICFSFATIIVGTISLCMFGGKIAALFLATIGGIIILVGLLLEKFSEKTWHKNINGLRLCESRKSWGEWFVMAGIFVEIIVAGCSAIDAWQIRQMAIKN